MKIGILSDSHLHTDDLADEDAYRPFFTKLAAIFKGVDHLIHAGDVVCEEFIRDLETIAPISVVQGNMDAYHGMNQWPKTLTLNFEGINIGVGHTPALLSSFEPGSIQVYIYGHTHVPNIKDSCDGVLLLNPGSVKRPRQSPQNRIFQAEEKLRPSIIILSIEDGILSAIIEKF